MTNKKKYGPALYELIAKSSGPGGKKGFTLPRWWRSGSYSAQMTEEAVAPTERVMERPIPATKPVPAAPEAIDRDRFDGVEAESHPLVDLVGDRIVLSTTRRMGAAALVAAVCLLGLVFYAGHAFGNASGEKRGFREGKVSVEGSTMNEIEAARASAPTDDELFVGTGGSPVVRNGAAAKEAEKASDAAAGQSAWIKGYTYIAVQDFKASEREAMSSAQEFLRERGVETSVKEVSGPYPYFLITNRGFNAQDPVQKKRLDEFWQEIKRIGKEYRKAGGRHDLEGYQRTLTRDNW